MKLFWGIEKEARWFKRLFTFIVIVLAYAACDKAKKKWFEPPAPKPAHEKVLRSAHAAAKGEAKWN